MNPQDLALTTSPKRSLLSAIVVAVICLGTFASAQLPLSLRLKFVDVRAGGNGNIGVTQDERSYNFYVLDFSNTNTAHEFDKTGKALGQFPTAGCNPSLTSPNGVTYDPTTDTLWFVDNNSGGMVLQTDRTGKCLGGFKLPPTTNAVGITYHRLTKTLFVSRNNGVDEYDLTGKKLTGGFSFTPSSGSAILSGITWVLPTQRFLITQSSGSRIFEVDKTGKLISTTSLTAFGIRNTQGLHYHLLTNRLAVVDNSLSTTFLFDMSLQPLRANVTEIQLSTGGTQVLTLNAGTQLANKSYWIFGSATGTTPGINLYGFNIPLMPDVYTDVCFVNANSTIFSNFKGTLSATGTATASLNVPKG
ncbi:MAG: hypothetical protein ACYTKC_10980, partial [Planctomycetota bacterium]